MLNDLFSKRVIPLLTGEFNAPFVWPTNAFYLNWRQLGRSIRRALPYVHGTCVDVGSGKSPYRKLLSHKVTRYISIDKSDAAEVFFPGCPQEFIDADIMDIPLEDGFADTLILTQVLEHIENPWDAMQEITRVLKINGTLVISVPFIYHAHGIPHDFHRFSEYGIKQLLKDNGYEIVEFHRQGYLGTALISLLNGFVWSLTSRWKTLRNIMLIPIIMPLFSLNNFFGILLDGIRINEFTPNFFVIARRIK